MYKEMFVTDPAAVNLLVKFIEDFNYFSESVQMNYQDLDDTPISNEAKRQSIRENLQRNMAYRDCIQEYLEIFSSLIGVEVKFNYGLHRVKWGTWEGYLFYKTADIEYDD